MKAARVLGQLKSGAMRLAGVSEKRLARERIARSGLFDEAGYVRHYNLSLSPDQSIDHFLEHWQTHPRVSALFDCDDYNGLNPDVQTAGVNPLAHYLKDGKDQGREVFSIERCKAVFGAAKTFLPLSQILPKDRGVLIHYCAAGNFFFEDIARYAASALAELGWKVDTVSDEDGPTSPRNGWTDLVVAPHEFMVIGAGQGWSGARQRSAAYLNTEQWQTIWFARCLPVMAASELGVVDINPTSAAAFGEIGIKAAFLPMLALDDTAFAQRRASLSQWFSRRKYIAPLTYPDRHCDRPYDVLFVGNLNTRREQILGQLAPALARYRNFLHCPSTIAPIRVGSGDMLSGRDFTQLALNAKILLNIHRDQLGYFEWHRLFLYGMVNGAVVLTEPSFPIPHLRAGIDYLECPAEDMGDFIDWLLATPDGRERLDEVSAAARQRAGGLSLSDWERP